MNPSQPNIILIMADDLGFGDIECFGNSSIKTPHINRLAEEGLRFTDYHANGPVCTPTRAALLTGCYQQRSNLEDVIKVNERDYGLDPEKNFCLARTLQQSGYATALLGKWHLGFKPCFNPVHHGFDFFRGYVSGNVDYHSHVDNAGNPDWWHNLEQIEEEGYVTDLLSEHADRFIRDHTEQPFFLYVAHEAPHFPYQGRYDKPDRFPGRKDFHAFGSRIDRVGAYKEMVEAMDDGVGRIMATLKELDLSENTLVIFCSDNGAFEEVGSNGPWRGFKSELYEGGHRVPAIAHWKGRIAAGTETGATVMSMDLLPTFLNLAGATPAPTPLDGVDISSVLFDQGSLPERTTFFRFKKQAAARLGPWKLLRDGETSLLFNLDNDPGEITDLTEQHPEQKAELTRQLAAWENAVG